MTPSRNRSDPDATIFEPVYGRVVTRVLPGVVALMATCGFVFLVLAPRSGAWLAVASFGVGTGFAGLYLWFLIYRRIEFGEETLVVRRYLFPDRRGRYQDVTAVSSMGFRLDGFPVACHTMENAGELRAILDDLRERGKIEPTEGEGLTASFRANLSATVKAATLGVVLWLVIQVVGLLPASIPDPAAAFGVILVSLLVGAPLIKGFSSNAGS